MRADESRLVIEAWDRSPGDLQTPAPADGAEAGRGLLIVAALSRRWGAERVGYAHKVVWAELAVPKGARRIDVTGR